MHKHSYLYVIIASLIHLTACTTQVEPDASSIKQDTEEREGPVYNLNDSTNIIRLLIKEDCIIDILELEDADPEQLNILLNNFSPAQMAFESEVLSCTLPVIVHFYKAGSDAYASMHKIIKELACTYENQIKFVEVNTETLYTIAQQAEVDQLPTLMFIKNRHEIERLEGIVDKKEIEDRIKAIIN